MLGAFLRGRADFGRGKFEAFGQQRRRALEAFARNSGHFGAAAFLVFGPGDRAGAGFAGRGERLVGLIELSIDPTRRFAEFSDLSFGGGEFGGDSGADGIPRFDLADQAGGFCRDYRAFLGDFLEPAGHRGEAAGGIASARLPRFDVAALGVAALTRDGESLVVRGQPGGGTLQALPCGIVAGLRGGKLGAAGFGIGQFGAAGLGGLSLGLGLAALFGNVVGAGGQFDAAGFDPGLGRLGLIERAQSGALGIGGSGQFALGGDHAQLQLVQFGGDGLRLGFRRFRRAAQCRQFGFEHGQAVLCLEPGGFGSTFALADKAIPAADPATLGNQPFAGAKRAAIVAFGNVDQCQPGFELVRALADMRGQAVSYGSWGVSPGPEPPVTVLCRTKRGLGIAAQNSGERAFITRRGPHRIKCDAAMLAGGLLGPGIAVANQRAMLAFHPGQFGLGRGERG